MSKTSSKKKNILIIFLVLALIMGGCCAAVGLYAKSAITEGTVELESEVVPSLTAEPDKAGFPEYLNKLCALTADSNKVKTNLETSLSIDEGSVSMDSSDADANVLKFALKSMTGGLNELYPSHDGKFGDGYSEAPVISCNGDDITEFTFEQGVVDEENEETKHEADFYYFNAVLGGAENPSDNANGICSTFNTAEIENVISKKVADFSDMFTLKSSEATVDSCTVDGKTNRLNDQLQYLTLAANYKLSFDVEFKGDYAALGEKKISFIYKVEEKYNYTWAGITIDETSVSIELGEELQLTVNAGVAEDASKDDYKLTVKSTDESIATFTKDGVVKGIKTSEKPVTVSLTLEYLGNTYHDECEVYVVVHVEKVKTQPEKISLSAGETKKLTCEITPDNATIKDVLWFTEDEKIAVIDEDGTVTAVGKGTVKVYAVSVDGHFRSSCEVEVK